MLVASGWTAWTKTLGIRADEPHRHEQEDQPREEIWMPLVEAGITKPIVLDFWSRQPFDLPEGVDSNCLFASNSVSSSLETNCERRLTMTFQSAWKRLALAPSGNSRGQRYAISL